MSALSPRAFLHRLITALIVAVVLSTVVIAGAYAQASRKVSKVATVPIDSSVLESGGNFLLIGSDSRAFVNDPTEAQHFGSPQEQTGQRSDTIMVAHVDGKTGTALLVSFPRDLWVAIPGIGNAKINAAFNAGPQRVIETIENDFDIPISHYLEVDFQGFAKMVNAIGTIPIYFPAPARDAKTGLLIKTAGCKQLNGDQALAYVRSRYYESFVDGQWRVGSHLGPRSHPSPAVLPAHARAEDAPHRGHLAVESEQPDRLHVGEPPTRPAPRILVAANACVRVPPGRWGRDPDAARQPSVHQRAGRVGARHSQGGAVVGPSARHREPDDRPEEREVARPVDAFTSRSRTGAVAGVSVRPRTTRWAGSASPRWAQLPMPIAVTMP